MLLRFKFNDFRLFDRCKN